MKIALVGCGFVADLYLRTRQLHPELQIAGVFDHDPQRLQRFCDFYQLHAYSSLQQLLESDSVLVLNLTNPRAHYAVSMACLNAGKHVYSEKPLAMELDRARELVQVARSKGLRITSAPGSLLGECAQTLWRSLRQGEIGPVRLVYAEMDDGLLHHMPYRKWQSISGTPWPWKDEFEVGCTLEHAGYCLTWLAAFFGPAQSVTAFSNTLIPNKQTDSPLSQSTPDFSVACIRFAGGVTARLTCGIVAPHDHQLTFHGDQGVLWTDDVWFFRSPVHSRRYLNIRRKMLLSPFKRHISLEGRNNPTIGRKGAAGMDFFRGVEETASAITENRRSRLPGDFALHCNELALAIHHAGPTQGAYTMTTSFAPLEPMPWAKQGWVAPKLAPMASPSPSKVLVTGAGGFLGRHVVAELLKAGHTVRALVRRSQEFPTGVEIFQADLAQADNLSDALQGIDVVVHLAGVVAGTDEQRRTGTVVATERLLSAMAKGTAKRLVLASSFSVYDYRKVDAVLTEATPIESTDVHQRDSYAVCKLEQENLCRTFARDNQRELVVLRPGAIWGKDHLLLPDLGQSAGPLMLLIAPRAGLKLSYVEHCAQAFALAVSSAQVVGETINVVDDDPPTARAYHSAVSSKPAIGMSYLLGLGISKVLGILPVVNRTLPGILQTRRYQARFKSLDCPNHQLKQLLGWQQTYTFEQALKRAVDGYD